MTDLYLCNLDQSKIGIVKCKTHVSESSPYEHLLMVHTSQ